MPTYSFKCPLGHIVEHKCEMEKRPDAKVCGTEVEGERCQEVAKRKWGFAGFSI